MVDESAIISLLNANKINPYGRVVFDSSGNGIYYVGIEVKRDSKNHQQPSNRKLQELKYYLEEDGQEIIFLLKSKESSDIEVGLRATLLHQYPLLIRNSFASFKNNNSHVWIDYKRHINETDYNRIKKSVVIYLQQFDIELTSLESTSGNNIPSLHGCLRELQLSSPATLDRLYTILIDKKYTIPSQDWLSRRLDLLRKSERVIRSKSGTYSLTLLGIQSLGRIKGRRSPDISRLLALARKG